MKSMDFSQSKIVLSAKIEYSLYSTNCDSNNEDFPKGILGRAMHDADERYYHERIKSIASQVIEDELPNEFAKDGAISFRTKILAIHEGCFEVHFSIENLLVTAPLVIGYALDASDKFSRLKTLYETVKQIATTVEKVLNNALKQYCKLKGIAVEPKEFIYKDSVLLDCDFEKLSNSLSHCAGFVEVSLINSGATLGKDFTKLDCFKLAMELMKNCNQLNHSP